MLDAPGHCPHLSAPDETIAAMFDFLGSDVTPPRVPGNGDAFDDQAPYGCLTMTPDRTVTEVNTTFLDWTGYRREEIVGTRRFAELLTPGGRAYYETHFAPLLSMHGAVRGIVLDLACLDGRVLPVLVHAVAREGSDDSPPLTQVTLLDATHRRAYERELLAARQLAERSDRRVRILHRVVAETAEVGDRAAVVDTLVRVLSDVFDGAGAAIWLLDAEGSTLSLAAANGVLSVPTPLLLPTDASPPAAAFREREPVMVDSAEQGSREFPMLADPLLHSPFGAMTAVPIVAGSVTLGAYALYFARSRFSDADEVELHRTLGCHAGQAIERAALYQELRHAASHDTLTDLPNRGLFDDRLEQALARSSRTARPLAVMVVDLNGFKQVNDWLGHRMGDTVLVETAHRLRAAVRPHDSVARIGGDEFAVLCEDVDRHETELIADRIRTALEPEIAIGTDRVSATGSVGAVVYLPGPGGTPSTPAQLLHEADAAMYRAKAGGKDAAEASHTALIGL
jgi:diguanylate cyclase (GGDEF)-like protein/PAS domain S-box-containing protein